MGGIRGAMYGGWSRALRGSVCCVYVDGCVLFGSMRGLSVPVVLLPILHGSLARLIFLSFSMYLIFQFGRFTDSLLFRKSPRNFPLIGYVILWTVEPSCDPPFFVRRSLWMWVLQSIMTMSLSFLFLFRERKQDLQSNFLIG
jgi:hypothetical protein